MRQWSGSSLIFKKDGYGFMETGTIVGPSSYGILMTVVGDFIVGNLDTEEEARKVPEVPDRYFIINTSTNNAMKELSFADYKAKMEELGFKELPQLIRPNKLTCFPH